MALDSQLGKKMLQLITSRYDDRHWRKKIEKTLSLPQSGVGDPAQQQIFMYLKIHLKAYKSRRADPDSWIVGGYATKEVIERAKFQPNLVGPSLTKDDLAFLGSDHLLRRTIWHFWAANPARTLMKRGGMRCSSPGSRRRKKRSPPVKKG